MIVLDSSVLVGLLNEESDVLPLMQLINAEEFTIGSPTLVETRVWCMGNLRDRRSDWLEAFVQADRVSVTPFGRDMADAASDAYARFGRRSSHPARLNFGDCMAYAVSAVLRAPLLFKGADFAQTDVMAHPSSIRN